MEVLAENRFTTRLRSHGGSTFGGEILGSAVLAAAHTCDGRPLHSLHGSFLRRVPPETPLELHVARLTDGRRFARRRIDIRLDDRLLCEATASFTASGSGAEFQELTVDDDVPQPENVATEAEVARAAQWTRWEPGPLEWRWIGTPWKTDQAAPSRYLAWVRPRFAISTEPGPQAAALAFLADYHSHWPVSRRLGGSFEPDGFVSLDQALWIHQDQPWDDWRLLISECDVAHGGRALSRRTLYLRKGRLVASMAQEALIPVATPVDNG